MDRNPETFLRSKGMRIYIYKYIYDSNISLQDTPYVLALSVFFSSCPMSRFFYPSADFFLCVPCPNYFFSFLQQFFFPTNVFFFFHRIFSPVVPHVSQRSKELMTSWFTAKLMPIFVLRLNTRWLYWWIWLNLERLCDPDNAVHVMAVVTQHVFSCISGQILFWKGHLKAKRELEYRNQIFLLVRPS